MAVFSRIPGLLIYLSGRSAPRSRSSHRFPIFLLLAVILLPGCSRLRVQHSEYVYVWSRQMFLRDRVAAVSNRVAEVKNGQRLLVLSHDRRFLHVKTDQGQIGWIPERAVIDQQIYDGFIRLATQQKDAPVVATATLRDDFYAHISPGRDTDRFYLFLENAKVQMLLRASVPKAQAPRIAPPPKPATTPENAKSSPKTKLSAPAPQPPPEPVAMEDWWLVRNKDGHVGWLLASRMDVDAPNDVAQYAEGQRIVGSYVLTHVRDEDPSISNHDVPEYVMALAPYKWGLPYDFDQIRVFTWNVKRHRYETAFRMRNIQGYLPVTVSSQPASTGGTEPVFTFQISTSAAISIDPDTGIAKPVSPRTISFALRQTVVRRTGPDQAPIPSIKSANEKPKPAAKSRRR